MGVGFVGNDDDSIGMGLSPQNLALLSQQIIEEVDTRTSRTIRKNKYSLAIFGIIEVSALRVVFRTRFVFFVATLFSRLFVVIGFSELTAKVGEQVGTQPKAKKYSRKNMLHKRMLESHPAYSSFVSGSKTGAGTHFHCVICKRDVAMRAQGSREFARHFQSDSHWFKDVVYRAHMGMPILSRLMEPMEVSEEQLAAYRAKPFVEASEGYPFPEELLPKHSRVGSRIPFMTFVGCLCDLLRSGGDFTLVRRLWSHFCLSLGKQKADFSLSWSRSETVVSYDF